jgi:hypothetical protein
MAVALLSHVPLPYQLRRVGIPPMDTIGYISKLAAGADTRRIDIHEFAWADQEGPGAASLSSSSSSSGGGEGSSEGDGSSSDSHSRDSDSGGSGSSEGSTTDSDEAVSQGQPQKRQRQALQQQPQVGSETAAGSALSGQASLARPRASHESSKIVVRHH